MSIHNASIHGGALPRVLNPSMHSGVQAPKDVGNDKADDLDRRNRRSRTACDVIIVLLLLASIAFIIVGLATPAWVYYGPTTTVPLYSRGLLTYCANVNQSGSIVQTCSSLDLGQTSTSTDNGYWNIIAIRRTEFAFFIISVVLTGFTLISQFACCVPSCRRRYRRGFWKGSIYGGVFGGLACAFQTIGMILFQVSLYYEAVYAGISCVDCYGVMSQAVRSQAFTLYGVAYALGWCASGILVYVSYAYLSREVCVIRCCRPPPPEETEEDVSDNLDAVSGVSSTPYLRQGTRNSPYAQPYGTPRLPRYDINAPLPQLQPTVSGYGTSPYGYTDLQY